jgi:hypothetical protein
MMMTQQKVDTTMKLRMILCAGVLLASSPVFAGTLADDLYDYDHFDELSKEAIANNPACAHAACIRRASDHAWKVYANAVWGLKRWHT